MGRQVIQSGGIPSIISYRGLQLPMLFQSEKDRRTIYEWREPNESVQS
jgi:hypothetical protein